MTARLRAGQSQPEGGCHRRSQTECVKSFPTEVVPIWIVTAPGGIEPVTCRGAAGNLYADHLGVPPSRYASNIYANSIGEASWSPGCRDRLRWRCSPSCGKPPVSRSLLGEGNAALVTQGAGTPRRLVGHVGHSRAAAGIRTKGASAGLSSGQTGSSYDSSWN